MQTEYMAWSRGLRRLTNRANLSENTVSPPLTSEMRTHFKGPELKDFPDKVRNRASYPKGLG